MTTDKNFWQGLPRPFFVLAPMEDVTDPAFRALIARKGKPHVFYTEFTSGDGLVLAPEEGRKSLMKKLEYGEGERPIVAQLFGSTPERMEEAAALALELGFDGLDINMGCPVKKIVDQGCGAALIRDPQKAKEIIRAAKRGVAGQIPVSVKTRIGYNSNELDTWLPAILEEDVATVTIHARTRKEMSEVPAHWDAVAQAVKIRDSLDSKTLIVGNGDVKDLADARVKAKESGCDGVMLGRAIYGNPWLFRDLHLQRPALLQDGAESLAIQKSMSPDSAPLAPRSTFGSAGLGSTLTDLVFVPTPRERIETLIEHIELFDQMMTGFVSFATMKKHFKAYVSGWDGAKELRMKLMDANSPNEATEVLNAALQTL